MTDRDDQPTEPQPEPLNREQRRRARFGAHGRETGAVPGDQTAGRGGDDDGSFAASKHQGAVKVTGAGGGGATEHDDRMPDLPSRHQPSRPNG